MFADAARLTRRFRRNERGNVAIMFGLSLVPVIFAVGAAVDYSRGAAERERLVQALDATGLALAHDAKSMPDAAFNAKANVIFASMYRSREVSGTPAVTTARANERLTVSTTAQVPTAFMHLAGFAQMPINARASVAYGTKKLEIALVLDNTGSMAQAGKMDALKVAAGNFVDQLAATTPSVGDIKVSVIPFATQVRTEPTQAGAPWLQMNGMTSWTWDGCVMDRDQPWDVNAESGALYPASRCAANTTKMMGLTDIADATQRNALKTRISSMNAAGNTNLTIGLTWGLASLTPASPLPGAASFNQANVEKFVVLLTDGDNTQNRFSNNSWSIDQRTQMACAAVKDPAKRVTVFTIRVIAGNQTLLRNCASTPGHYYESANAAQIQPAFNAILQTITKIHLSN